eukprot:scaffold129918_cov37-Tisochrysis_lutea.AAC.3
MRPRPSGWLFLPGTAQSAPCPKTTTPSYRFIQRLFFEETLEKVASKEFTAGALSHLNTTPIPQESLVCLTEAYITNVRAPSPGCLV